MTPSAFHPAMPLPWPRPFSGLLTTPVTDSDWRTMRAATLFCASLCNVWGLKSWPSIDGFFRYECMTPDLQDGPRHEKGHHHRHYRSGRELSGGVVVGEGLRGAWPRP